ncbi:hypothetical protein BGZ46_009347 [Entomortierella lignicola]|nr:hypothetical protein BGZ46_009347 [Entomortierella lignicola]
MDARKNNLGYQKATHGQSTTQHREETSSYPDSVVEKEITQRAATALYDHSELLLHALSMNETPAKARLRMYRHLTGQPQPLHDYTPVKRKHKETDSAYPSSSINSGASSSSRAGSSGSSLSTAAQGGQTSSSRPRRDIIPVDEEFPHTFFQGQVS